MDTDKPDGTIEYDGYQIEYYEIGNRIHLDSNQFDAFMSDSTDYVPPARDLFLKLDARSAISVAKSNGKEDFADFLIRKFTDKV